MGCRGCISRHTWDKSHGELITVAGLLERIEPQLESCDKVTISGGEPFDQPAALSELVTALRLRGVADILLYSGYRHEFLKRQHPEILEQIAALVDGEFILGDETKIPWKGSENQRLFILSRESGLQQRYRDFTAGIGQEQRLQVIGTGGKILVVGIPRQRDAEALFNGAD
jgi:anaerobic ribonucleoside-triphosphate reductase activating protein